MATCSSCGSSSSGTSTGCNCGKTGCTSILQDKCVSLSKALDICGAKTIPAGTYLDSALATMLEELCDAIDGATTGATGATGAKGEKGDTGAKGDTGDKGEKGDAGDDGVDGRDGYIILHAKQTEINNGATVSAYVEPSPTWDYTLPANTLLRNGDFIDIEFFTATCENTYEEYGLVKISFGGTNILNLNAANLGTTETDWTVFYQSNNVAGFARYTKTVLRLVRASATEIHPFLVVNDLGGNEVEPLAHLTGLDLVNNNYDIDLRILSTNTSCMTIFDYKIILAKTES